MYYRRWRPFYRRRWTRRRRTRRATTRRHARGFHRRRTVRRRHRRHRVHKKTVSQDAPTHTRYCHIKGWLPILMTDTNSIHKRFTTVKNQTWIFKDYWTISPGGWVLGNFKLEGLFNEHKGYRNRWTDSNEGMDLALYYGTKITLHPHPWYPYIFWWDADYYSTEDFKDLIHPAFLMNQKNTRIVLPYSYAGHRRKRPHVFVEPPASMQNSFKFSKDINQFGLFAWGASLIDFENPFLFPETTFPASQRDKWWDSSQVDTTTHKPKWISDWGSESASSAAKYGPFVQKGTRYKNGDIVQLFMTYDSIWKWGGDTLPQEHINDPDRPQVVCQLSDGLYGYHRGARNPRHPSRGLIRRGDCSSPGLLTSQGIKRLTRSSSQSSTDEGSTDGLSSICSRRTRRTQKKKKKKKAKETRFRHLLRRRGIEQFLHHCEQQLGQRVDIDSRENLKGLWKTFIKHRPKNVSAECET